MKHLAVLFLLISVVFAFDESWNIEPAVVNGSPATPHQYPFMVAIHWVTHTPVTRSRHACGGVLLNNRWVLTAAHCITETPRLGDLFAHLGSHSNRIDESGILRVEINRRTSIIHPDFSPGRSVGPDDMALLNMLHNVAFSHRVQPIALPQPNTIPTGTTTLAGWGSMRPDGQGSAPVLQHVELQFIRIDQCRNLINNMNMNGSVVDNTNVCTGPGLGRSACLGDSGGPVFVKQGNGFVVQGIMSWIVRPCGRGDGPSGIFKRVSAYIDWIRVHTGVTPP